jgi:hypothetical protein
LSIGETVEADEPDEDSLEAAGVESDFPHPLIVQSAKDSTTAHAARENVSFMFRSSLDVECP